MVGMLAKSKAGHDKDNIYVIFQEDDAYVYLVDGKSRTTDKPKKKNKRHIQIIKNFRAESGEMQLDDLSIKRTIKEYCKSIEKCQGN